VPTHLSRPQLLEAASMMAAATMATPFASRVVRGQPRSTAYPFLLGAASGDTVAAVTRTVTQLAGCLQLQSIAARVPSIVRRTGRC
jgi:hypothetical protein